MSALFTYMLNFHNINFLTCIYCYVWNAVTSWKFIEVYKYLGLWIYIYYQLHSEMSQFFSKNGITQKTSLFKKCEKLFPGCEGVKGHLANTTYTTRLNYSVHIWYLRWLVRAAKTKWNGSQFSNRIFELHHFWSKGAIWSFSAIYVWISTTSITSNIVIFH